MPENQVPAPPVAQPLSITDFTEHCTMLGCWWTLDRDGVSWEIDLLDSGDYGVWRDGQPQYAPSPVLADAVRYVRERL
jgi:hypothetical protein